jgi:hypothetical protein
MLASAFSAALRCFFRFCVESDYLERDPAHVLRTPKKREALLTWLDRRELARLLDVPGQAGVWKRVHAGKRERDRLLLAVFSYGGLRRSELLGLSCSGTSTSTRHSAPRARPIFDAEHFFQRKCWWGTRYAADCSIYSTGADWRQADSGRTST